MQTSFGGVPIINGSSISTAQASGQLALIWPANSSYYYTVMMLDGDAPYPKRNTSSPFLHFLQTNIPGNDISRGNILIPYLAAKPPTDSAPHNYVITIFQQSKIINADLPTSRERYNWNRFIQMYGLDAIYSLQFKVSSANVGSTVSSPNSVEIKPSFHSNPGGDKSNWIITGTTLDEREQKYCRCILEVANKNPTWCNLEKAYFETRLTAEGAPETCYNVYSVCAKSVGTTTRQCGENYNYDVLPDSQLMAFANLRMIGVPEPYNRIEMLRRIKEWKDRKY